MLRLSWTENPFSQKKELVMMMILLFAVTLVDGLDNSLVSVTLPTIAADFGMSVSDSSWLINAYILGISIFLLAFAKMCDRGFLRQMFVYGLLIFVICSVICAVTPDRNMMIISRFFQGIGGSMMGATGPIIVIRLMPKEMKGRGMGVMAAASGLALVIGPAAGGAIASMLSWHWIFLINVPIGAVLILMGLKYIPKMEYRRSELFPDVRSVIFSALFLASSLVALENIVQRSVPIYVMVICVIVALVSLILLIGRMKKRITNHLIRIEMFRNRDLMLVSAAFLLTTMVAAGVEYLLPYFFMGEWGFDQMKVGLYMTVTSVFTIIATFIAGRWCDSKGCKGAATLAVIFRIVFSVVFAFIVPGWGLIPLIVNLAIMGLSFGLSGTSQPTRIVHHSEPEYQGEASAFMLTINYVASALGVVFYAMIYSAAQNAGMPIGDCFHLSVSLGIILCILALIATLVVRNIRPEEINGN